MQKERGAGKKIEPSCGTKKWGADWGAVLVLSDQTVRQIPL